MRSRLLPEALGTLPGQRRHPVRVPQSVHGLHRAERFGGQVAAQAVVAATRSVESQFVLHSLHSYFLRPGDTTVPIVYDVERIRDGRSFVTRRVSARQHGRPPQNPPGRTARLDASTGVAPDSS